MVRRRFQGRPGGVTWWGYSASGSRFGSYKWARVVGLPPPGRACRFRRAGGCGGAAVSWISRRGRAFRPSRSPRWSGRSRSRSRSGQAAAGAAGGALDVGAAQGDDVQVAHRAQARAAQVARLVERPRRAGRPRCGRAARRGRARPASRTIERACRRPRTGPGRRRRCASRTWSRASAAASASSTARSASRRRRGSRRPAA